MPPSTTRRRSGKGVEAASAASSSAPGEIKVRLVKLPPLKAVDSRLLFFFGLLSYGGVCFAVLSPSVELVNTPSAFGWWCTLCFVLFLCSLTAIGQYSAGKGSWKSLLVVACYAHRSFFMHCTVERHCFFDFSLCSPLWGRTVACTGELTFVSQAASALFPRKPKVQSAIFWSIALAQTLSFIGVCKKNYVWFFFENGIWTVVATTMAIRLLGSKRPKALDAVPYLLACFVCYNVFEDLPMYLARHAETSSLPGYDLPLIEGAVDAVSCDLVTSTSNATWQPQMLWMWLNYTLNPIASIYLARYIALSSSAD